VGDILNTKTMEYTKIWDNFTGSGKTDILAAAQKGDLDAFNQIVLFYQDKVFSMALRILGDADSAEDITQNTFLAAFRSLTRFRGGSFRSWLYRIATNACYDELRRRRRSPVQLLEDETENGGRSSLLDDMHSFNILPENEYERHEVERTVQRALNRLDADQRAVVVLIDLQDFVYQEAAQILGIPIGTVKSRLARARLQLRHLLRTFGSPDDGLHTRLVN
jgi:RNA polymerase sigma factor (sigma-70 family)